MTDRRIRLLMIDSRALRDLLKLPPEVAIDEISHIDFETNSIVIKVRSEKFDPVREGDLIPRVVPLYWMNEDGTTNFHSLREYARECYSDQQIEYTFPPAPAQETPPGDMTRAGAVEQAQASAASDHTAKDIEDYDISKLGD
jgi:hypothetical protein